jgi:protein ImuA
MSLGGSAEMARLKRAIAEIEGAGRNAAPRVEPGGSERGASAAGRLPVARVFDRALGGGLADDALHEIVPASPMDGAATMGFALALAARLLDGREASGLVVSEAFTEREAGALYGPGLVAHGLPLNRLVFVRAPDADMGLWAMEEALKCGAPAVVVGEIWSLKGYSLTASRRLLIAARKGRTPALLVLASAYGQADRLSSAAETRFEIAAAPSAKIPAAAGRGLPGPFACEARLVKARLGAFVDAVADRASMGRAQQGVRKDARLSTGYRARLHDPGQAIRLEWRSEERTFDDPAISLALAAASGDGPGAAARGH